MTRSSIFTRFALGCCMGVTLCLVASSHYTDLAVGDQAPDFALPSDSDILFQLSAYRGSKVALVFYPKDNYIVCTKQACSLRDGLGMLQAQGIQVWGINTGTSRSHRLFRKKHQLNFPLLIDTHKDVTERYGAKGFLFNKRITVLIDEYGYIVAILTDIDIDNHAQQILKAFGL